MVAVAEEADFTVADALRKFAPAYIAKYLKRMPPHHRKVLGLITRCKTGELGNVMYRCQSCQARHWVGRSCGNRHCPNCQKEKTQQWLAKQNGKLLPVNAVTSIKRSVRLKAESHSTDCSAASKQKPTRFFADSGLLEQRI